MLLDRFEASFPLCLEVVKLFASTPPQKPFEVLDEGKLVSSGELRKQLTPPFRKVRLHKVIVALTGHINTLALAAITNLLGKSPILQAAITEQCTRT